MRAKTRRKHLGLPGNRGWFAGPATGVAPVELDELDPWGAPPAAEQMAPGEVSAPIRSESTRSGPPESPASAAAEPALPTKRVTCSYCLGVGVRRGTVRTAKCWDCDGDGGFEIAPGQDAVTVGERTFTRSRAGVHPNMPDAIRVEADRELSEDQTQRLAQLIGYHYAATVRGERMGDPLRDSPYSLVLGVDITKSRSDDVGLALEDFEDGLVDIVRDGSPVRKTDRAGVGTRGTRLVEGLGETGLAVYYDSVFEV